MRPLEHELFAFVINLGSTQGCAYRVSVHTAEQTLILAGFQSAYCVTLGYRLCLKSVALAAASGTCIPLYDL